MTPRKKRAKFDLLSAVMEDIDSIKNGKPIFNKFLEVRPCGVKGNGLFTTKRLEQGEYVLAYTGLYLENEPPADTNDDYVYEVYHNKKKYWIDAEKDSGLAKFINDNHKRPNLRTKMVIINELPVPVFFTLAAIEAGQELDYDYGGGMYAWRMKGQEADEDSYQEEADENRHPDEAGEGHPDEAGEGHPDEAGEDGHPDEAAEDGHPEEADEEGHPDEAAEDGHRDEAGEDGHPEEADEEGHPEVDKDSRPSTSSVKEMMASPTPGQEADEDGHSDDLEAEMAARQFDPTDMTSILELSKDQLTYNCQLCLKKVGKAQILRHLRKYHKCHPATANFYKSTTKQTKRSRLKCTICGKLCSCLTSHLRTFHGKEDETAKEIMNTTKKRKHEYSYSDEFIDKFTRYEEYSEKMAEKSYKPKSRYLKSSHLPNIKRMAKQFAENEMDICDLLNLPTGDIEAEECTELAILNFISIMKGSSNEPDSAVVYLGDLKKFIGFFYRFNARIPLRDFITKHIQFCKKGRKGKMKLNKYMDQEDLVDKIAHHYDCPLSTNIREILDVLDDPTDDLECRNYLMTRLLIENVQRTGAICHLTLAEYNSAISTRGKDNEQKYTFVVSDHKSASTSGPANLHTSHELHSRIGAYIKYVRTASDCQYVFVTETGNAISNSCAWAIFQRHLKRCNIGVEQFNSNSWRRAGNTRVQETGNEVLIEAAARQLTHSTAQGKTTYYNDVSAQRSAEHHSTIMTTIFTKKPVKRSAQFSSESETPKKNMKLSENGIPGRTEEFENITPRKKISSIPERTIPTVSPRKEVLTPTKTGRRNRYFRDSDRSLIKIQFKEMVNHNLPVTEKEISKILTDATYQFLTNGRSVKLTKDQLSHRIYSFLKSIQRNKKEQ